MFQVCRLIVQSFKTSVLLYPGACISLCLLVSCVFERLLLQPVAALEPFPGEKNYSEVFLASVYRCLCLRETLVIVVSMADCVLEMLCIEKLALFGNVSF